jgi:hypothetical protein
LPTRKTTTVSSVIAGALLLAACGGGGGGGSAQASERDDAGEDPAATFCAGAQALYDQFLAAGNSAPTSPAMQAVYATAESLEPPEDIAADWQTVVDAMTPVMTGQVDIADPAVAQEFNESLAANAESYQRVGRYVGDVCGIGATTTSVSTP